MSNHPALLVFMLASVAVPLLLAWRSPATIITHRLTVLGLLAAMTALAAGALIDVEGRGLHISLDPSEEPMLARDEAGRAVYREAIDTFGDDDVFVVAMAGEDVFSAENLELLRTIGNDIRRMPGVRSTESIVDTITYRYDAELDLIEVRRFIDDVPSDGDELARLRRLALSDRIYPRSLVAADGRAAAINVLFRTMSDGEFVATGIDDTVRTMLDAHETAGRRFFVTGRKHIKARAHRIMIDDLLLLIPLAVVVGATVAWLVTGSLLNAVIPVGASLMATWWAFGLLAWLGRPLNLITLVLGPMLICVGSVYGVHVLARYQELAADRSDDDRAALACLRDTFTPVFIAGFTTCVGFSALLLSDTPAIRELGAFSVLGVASITVISVTGVPALLDLSRPRLGVGGPTRIAHALDAVLDLFARAGSMRPGAVLVGWTLITAAALACIPSIVVDSDYLTFFDQSSRVRRDFQAVNDELVGAVPIYVTIDGGAEGAFREPANLRAVERLQSRIDGLAGVSATLSAVDLVSVLNRALEKDDPAAERIPATRGEVAELLFLVPKNKLRRFASSNHSKVNILVRTGHSGSAAVLDLERHIREAAAATLPAGLAARVTGNAIVVNHGANSIARNQLSTVGAAAVAIFVLVWRAFRSARVGALAMLPNLVPVSVFFGVLGAGAASLSLPTSLIGCIALGIAIDDTAHFLVGYRRQRRAGAAPEAAADACVRTLGRPIVTTSLMLVAGFSVLSLSGFATLREFGYLSAATMFVCLCADLLLLPAILVKARA